MTVTANDSRDQHNGNGATTVFAYTFKILDQTHIQVILTDTNGNNTTKTITTHYTVSGVGNSGGGNITMLTAPASGEKLTFLRNVPLSQETDYTEGGAFPAESHETALDKLTMIAQQISEVNSRTVTLSASANLSVVSTALPTPTASKILAWNASATAIENIDNYITTTTASQASAAQINAGSDSIKYIAPDALNDSNYGLVPIEFSYSAGVSPTVGNGAAQVTIPARMDGMNIVAVEAEFTGDVATGSTTTIMLHNATSAADILTVALTIDSGERSSATAATAAVINEGEDDLTTGDLIRLDIDGIGSSAAGSGLVVRALCRRP